MFPIGGFKVHIFKVVGNGINEAWEAKREALSGGKLESDAQNGDSASAGKLQAALDDLQCTPGMRGALP